MRFTEILGWVIMCNLALVCFLVLYLMYYVVMGLDVAGPTALHRKVIRNILDALYVSTCILFALVLMHHVLIT